MLKHKNYKYFRLCVESLFIIFAITFLSMKNFKTCGCLHLKTAWLSLSTQTSKKYSMKMGLDIKMLSSILFNSSSVSFIVTKVVELRTLPCLFMIRQ